MKKLLLCLFLAVHCVSFANSVSLLNNSIYTLKAIIYDATGTLLGEFILNPRDATEWSDDQMFYGTDIHDASQTPYMVDWLCMGGTPFGTCTNVAAGSLVTAQSCSGEQQCKGQQKSGY